MNEADLKAKREASFGRYWRANLKLTLTLLFFWALLGLGAGILFADYLNEYSFFGTGYPLGFWFAQQGSIIGFVIIVFIYAVAMNRLDKKHHNELLALESEKGGNQ